MGVILLKEIFLDFCNNDLCHYCRDIFPLWNICLGGDKIYMLENLDIYIVVVDVAILLFQSCG